LRGKGRFYDFDAGDLDLSPNDWVIVETKRGKDAGQIIAPPTDISPEEIHNDLKRVVRLATASDLRRMERSRDREENALKQARAQVEEMGLPMRLVQAEYTFNARSLTLYFTAEKRVDFRNLVKTLARKLRTRIELRQIGSRDEARLLGGIGPCGRPLCCTTFLRDFLRISVRMAKEQDLPLSPMKISGCCGRLLCCLSYEYEQYRDIKAQLPKVGDEVITLRGRGKVVSLSVPREAVVVEVRPGLTVKATAKELAEAAQLEAEGQLAPIQPSYVPLPREPVRSKKTAPSSKPAKKRSRRRRRKKKAGAPAAQRTGQRQQEQQQPKKKPPPKAQQGQASRPAGKKKRRRRPRRSPPRQSSGEKKGN
jgi:cell fate regulator YaaT (PSP1 superfamily)